MRTTALTAGLALCLAASTAGAQQPTTPTTPPSPTTPTSPTSPTQPSTGSGTMQDTAGAAGAAGAQADTSLVGNVQAVLQAARSGLTSVPVATAASLVGSIESQLRASNSAPLRSIANDLRALRSELGSTEVSGRRVGVILRRVGPKVTRVSARQTGAVRTALRELGSTLASEGRRLSAPAGAAGAR